METNTLRSLIILAREHRALRAIAARFEHELTSARATGLVDGEAAARLLEFFEHEIDGHHQEKEERAFLPRLAAAASGAEREALHGLVEDHARERELLASLRRELEAVAYGDPGATATFVCDARAYLGMQREHSRREEALLFPLAPALLSERADLAVLAHFRQLDHEWGGTVWEAARALEAWLDRHRAPAPLG
jgi:hemerythrin-like domain-containing protein